MFGKKGHRKGRAKKTTRRAHRKNRGETGYFKQAAHQNMMVNKASARLHNLVAPKFLTKLEYGFTGAHTLAAGTVGYFDVKLNSLHFPGNANDPFTGAQFGGTLYPATLALNALNPDGYSQLGVLYSTVKVLASKFTITCTPTGSVDCGMCVYPVESPAALVADYQQAQSLPYSKAIVCTGNNNIRQNTIQSYMDGATLAGLSKRQYIDDNYNFQATIGADPHSIQDWVVIITPFAAGSALSNNIQVRVTYWVEFFDPLPPTDV